MVAFERTILRILRYRKVFFANEEETNRLVSSLASNEVLRMFGISHEIDNRPNLISRVRANTVVIDLTQGLDAILRAMSPKGCRYEIRRAAKLASQLDIAENSAAAQADFLSLYNCFARTKGPVPPLSRSRFEEFLPAADTFVLYLNGRAMCGRLVLVDNNPGVNRAVMLHSCTRRLESKEDAALCGALNRYLHWHEIKRYAEQGLHYYDFGGIRDDTTHPVSRFKRSFGGEVSTTYSYVFAGVPAIGRLGHTLYRRFTKAGAVGAVTLERERAASL